MGITAPCLTVPHLMRQGEWGEIREKKERDFREMRPPEPHRDAAKREVPRQDACQAQGRSSA